MAFTSTRYYEREWRDSSPSRPRLFDHHRDRLLDDPFFRRSPGMPYSGSLESLRTVGLISGSGAGRAPPVVETKYSSSFSSGTTKTEERAYEDERTRFSVTLDLRNYGPDDVTVKVADDMLLVEASHREKPDEYAHGHVTRSLARRYPLPRDVDAQGIVSELTRDGLLTIRAPKVDQQQRARKERSVPIQVVKTPPPPPPTAGPSGSRGAGSRIK